jgi:hypothetical protein
MKILAEILSNKWFLNFIVGWVVFFILVEWKELHVNVWGGILACILQLIHDTSASNSNFYHFYDVGIGLLKTSIFFTFGVVFTMGVIFLQFIPKSTKLKIIHVIVFSIGFLTYEYIVVHYGMLKHLQYSYWISLADNVIVMSTLAWTKSFVIFVYNFIGRRMAKC